MNIFWCTGRSPQICTAHKKWCQNELAGILGPQWVVWTGCEKTLNILHTELDMTMALCGRRDIHDLNRDNIYSPK